jgi:streptogramin lyase
MMLRVPFLFLTLLLVVPGASADLLVSNYTRVLGFDEATGAPLYILIDEGDEFGFGPDGELYATDGNGVSRFHGESGAFIDRPITYGYPLSPDGLFFGPDGRLYVFDSNAQELLVYDTSLTFITSFFVGNLQGLVFGPDGNIYISRNATITDRVLVYDGTSYALVGALVTGSGLDSPRGIAFGPDGNLYVANSGTDEVLRYDGTTGAFIDAFVPTTQGTPWSVLFGADGMLYVGTSDVVERFDATTGAFVDTFINPLPPELGTAAFMMFSSIPTDVPGVDVVLDSAGAGPGQELELIAGMAVATNGDLFVTGNRSDNIIEVDPVGTTTELAVVNDPRGIGVDASGTLAYAEFNSAFRLVPGGSPVEIVDGTGDGMGGTLNSVASIAVAADGTVYVPGRSTDNVLKITPGGVITEIIDASGDGLGNALDTPSGVAVDASGNVYVTGGFSDNAFEISSGGVITQIIDAAGDGAGNPLEGPTGIAVRADGTVVVAGSASDNAFEISPGGVVTQIIDASGAGAGSPLDSPRDALFDGDGDVWLTGGGSQNVFQIGSMGIVEEVDVHGGGPGETLESPNRLAIDLSRAIVYVSSRDRVLRIGAPPVCDDGLDNDFDTLVDALDPGCDDAFDDSERSDTLVCDDGVDNDRDTLTDFPLDSGCLSSTHVTEVGDEDADGVLDDADNCSLIANAGQVDSDGDFCGNPCDSDYNNDGASGVPDFNIFRLAFGTTIGEPGYVPGADHNSDGLIGVPDHNTFRNGVGKPPGPSGTTPGTPACP